MSATVALCESPHSGNEQRRDTDLNEPKDTNPSRELRRSVGLASYCMLKLKADLLLE